MANLNWHDFSPNDISIEILLTILQSADEPMHLNLLTHALAKDQITKHEQTDLPPIPYNPFCNYASGMRIQLPDRQVASIHTIIDGYNEIQGSFQILDFVESDLPRLAAGLEPHQPIIHQPVYTIDESKIEDQVVEILRSDIGPHIRYIVRQKLQMDECVVSFGDEWWLTEKLPYTITKDDVECLRQILKEQAEAQSIPDSNLAALLWNSSFEDPVQKHSAVFTLNCTLAQEIDFCYLRTGEWILSESLPSEPLQKRPHVPRIHSQLLPNLKTRNFIHIDSDLLSLPDEETDSNENSTASILWEDLDYWRRNLAWPEARVLLLGQYYSAGFLPLQKNSLRRVIPPSNNDVELAWFIIRQPDNTENRIQVAIDYQQNIVVGGPPLHDYFASQGILPGCYIFVHRRNDVEYDIYPKLLSQPVDIEKCKFAWIDDNDQLVIEMDNVQTQYEHHRDYIVSETRLEDMDGLWREATELNLSFFDILIKLFEKLAPAGQSVHWKKLWEAAFYGYRMGSQQAIQRELRRQCFVSLGDGFYQFEPERGYSFPSRKSGSDQQATPSQKTPLHKKSDITTEEKKEDQPRAITNPATPTEQKGGMLSPPPTHSEPPTTEPSAETSLSQSQPQTLEWANIAKLEAKYLIPGPSPLGRILNYIPRIKEQSYSTIKRGPRDSENLDQWTVYAMVGLGLVQRLEETGKPLQLTPSGEQLYPRLRTFETFAEADDSTTIYQIRIQLEAQDKEFYGLLQYTFLTSPALRLLLAFLSSLNLPISLNEFYTRFTEFCPEMNSKVTVEHRLPGLIRIAEFCQAINRNSEGCLILTDVNDNLNQLSKLESDASETKITAKTTATSIQLPLISLFQESKLKEEEIAESEANLPSDQLLQFVDILIFSRRPLTQKFYNSSELAHFITTQSQNTSAEEMISCLLNYLTDQVDVMEAKKQAIQNNFRRELVNHVSPKQMDKLEHLYTPQKPPKKPTRNYTRKLNIYRQTTQIIQAQLGSLTDETLYLNDFWRLNQRQWMWLLSQNIGQIHNINDLTTLHQKYTSEITPLIRHLQRTNWLIDQIISQYYDLTGIKIERPLN